MTRKMKDSGVEWIGEIPEDWEVVRNKNLFKNKKEIVGNEFETIDRLALTLKGVIDRDKLDSGGLQPTNFDTYQKVNKNNLIFKLIDLENINTSRVGLAHKDGMVSPAYVVLYSNSLKKDIRYYHYFYLSMWHRNIFNMLGDGGVRSNLNKTDLLSLNTLKINYNEQKSIADFLDKKTQEIDNIISKTKKAIEEYKRYKQSLITETVTKGLDENVEMKDSGIEWIGEIPEHWDVIRLQSLVKLRDSKGLYNPEEDLYIGLENIESYTGKYMSTNTKYEESMYSEFKSKDILFNTLRPYLTKVYLTNSSGYCTSEFLIIKEYMGIKKYLFYQLINSRFIELINSSTYGSKMPRANWNFMKDIYLPISPLEEQEQISNYLDKKTNQIDQIISTKEKLLIEMEDYKKSLIYETVTGKREVE